MESFKLFFLDNWPLITSVFVVALIFVSAIPGKVKKVRSIGSRRWAIMLYFGILAIAAVALAPVAYANFQELVAETREYQWNGNSIVVKGRFSESTLNNIWFACTKFEQPEMLRDLRYIVLTSSMHVGSSTIAHAENQRRVICIGDMPKFKREDMWHEAAHIRSFILGKTFLERWKRIADIEYSERVEFKDGAWIWKKDAQAIKSGRPRHGCTSPYGGTDVFEDIAEFCAAAYGLLYNADSALCEVAGIKVVWELRDDGSLSPATVYERRNIFVDPRYKQKLDILKEYKFISPKQHLQVKQILGW